jgi:tRNA A-37 threonylcarbamoyl transferase component Bud32
MPDEQPHRTDPTPDRNLLFGILALQMDFISRHDLIAAMSAWVVDKSRSLGQILQGLGALRPDACDLLEALVEKHLELHGNDPRRSLAALGSAAVPCEQLRQVPDADLHASLAHCLTRSAAQGEPCGLPTDPAAARPVEPGPRFRILRPHARGGFGQVSVALEEDLHREVALKEIQEPYAHQAGTRARFLQEARITAGLEHPGIVPVYGFGSYPDGRPFYAMRFIRGESFDHSIRRYHEAVGDGPSPSSLELRKLLVRFLQVCNAVAYAHSRGVLHRDLKPGNIMLGTHGETLVVDWGLAKVMSRPEGPVVPVATLALPLSSVLKPTQLGSALGTPAYLSPEQAAGRVDELGPASDIYSLGATLYHLLTG